MTPTAHLRWREATLSEELREACVSIARSSGGERYLLEQLWRDDFGRSEWRAVKLERPKAKMISAHEIRTMTAVTAVAKSKAAN